MLNIAVNGAKGRMGRRVCALALEAVDIALSQVLVRPGDPDAGRSAGEALQLSGAAARGLELRTELAAGADVLIDFSRPGALPARLAECHAHGTAVVSGTTGLDAAAEAALALAAKTVPVLHATNMSMGALLLRTLAVQAALALGPAADVEIVEVHHGQKKDAPSGTALTIAHAVLDARGADRAASLVHWRSGPTGARPAGQVGVHAVRAGDVTGEHTVYLAVAGERLELVHRAHTRDAFAAGALRAARWLARRAPGRYAIDQVLAGA